MDPMRYISGQIIVRAYSFREQSRLFSHLTDLEHSQWLRIEKLKEYQLTKLKNILVHSFNTVEFYRKRFLKAGFDPGKLKSINDLKNLPLLTKQDIMDNTESLLSRSYDHRKLIRSRTGGSTGTQLHFYITKESVDQKNACAWRHNRWANWDLGMPIAAVWGNPKSAITLKEKLRQKFLNRIFYLDTMNMTSTTMNEFVCKINKSRDYVLFGHSHSIFILSKYIKNQGIKILSPRGIVSTSMMLMANERSIIEEVFRQKVTDRYGCEEVGLIASECDKHCGMHLNMDHVLVEFVKKNGSDASPGEEGRIVLTDLTNFGMPFIRYEVGDVGVPTDRLCECGRGLALMKQVTGRTADFLVRKDGSLVAGVSLIERILTNIPGIYQMQIIQDDMSTMLVKLVKAKDYSDVSTMNRLRIEFEAIFPGTSMKIDFTDHIPQEPSGKYRFSICNVK